MSEPATNERSLVIVRNHRPDRVPGELPLRDGIGVVALVLSTFRSDSPDMILDHKLWLACMDAVGNAVGATRAELYRPSKSPFWDWIRGREAHP